MEHQGIGGVRDSYRSNQSRRHFFREKLMTNERLPMLPSMRKNRSWTSIEMLDHDFRNIVGVMFQAVECLQQRPKAGSVDQTFFLLNVLEVALAQLILLVDDTSFIEDRKSSFINATKRTGPQKRVLRLKCIPGKRGRTSLQVRPSDS
jgi:hypothetical protein